VPDRRRWYVPGGTYFFTLVTQDRRPLFTEALARAALRGAIEAEQAVRPFEPVAIVLLPDHLHAVWTLPAGDADYPTRWRRIKERFTEAYLGNGGREARVSAARSRRAERGVWQRRYWEHVCRDEDDLERCLDYLHWNPVKHGYARRPADWPYSTFEKFVRLGQYEPGWGGDPPADVPGAEWE
jgi:putative transposase